MQIKLMLISITINWFENNFLNEKSAQVAIIKFIFLDIWRLKAQEKGASRVDI